MPERGRPYLADKHQRQLQEQRYRRWAADRKRGLVADKQPSTTEVLPSISPQREPTTQLTRQEDAQKTTEKKSRKKRASQQSPQTESWLDRLRKRLEEETAAKQRAVDALVNAWNSAEETTRALKKQQLEAIRQELEADHLGISQVRVRDEQPTTPEQRRFSGQRLLERRSWQGDTLWGMRSYEIEAERQRKEEIGDDRRFIEENVLPDESYEPITVRQPKLDPLEPTGRRPWVSKYDTIRFDDEKRYTEIAEEVKIRTQQSTSRH